MEIVKEKLLPLFQYQENNGKGGELSMSFSRCKTCSSTIPTFYGEEHALLCAGHPAPFEAANVAVGEVHTNQSLHTDQRMA